MLTKNSSNILKMLFNCMDIFQYPSGQENLERSGYILREGDLIFKAPSNTNRTKSSLNCANNTLLGGLEIGSPGDP